MWCRHAEHSRIFYTLQEKARAKNDISPLSLPLIIMMLDYLLAQHRVDDILPYYITTIQRYTRHGKKNQLTTTF